MTFGKNTINVLAVAALSAVGLAFNVWTAFENRAGWGLDYNQFYSGSRLVGTGHLYDFEALRKIELQNGYQVVSSRLPVVIYGHKLLSFLPYRPARVIWLVVSLSALFLFAGLWPGNRRLLMMGALLWSMPATLLLLYGQDTPFWLLFFTAGLLSMERKRPWLAGVLFSLCICKFHLALAIPVMLAAQKRWGTLIAGAISTLVLLASCFLVEGPGWVMEYVRLSQTPDFSPASERMPNLHGVASWLPWPAPAEIICALVVVFILWSVCRSGAAIGTAGAATAACGLLVGHHAYVGDCVLLIPLAVLTLQRESAPAWIKGWAIVALSPVPMALIVSEKPQLGQLLIVGFAVTAIAIVRYRQLELAAPAGCLAGPQSA